MLIDVQTAAPFFALATVVAVVYLRARKAWPWPRLFFLAGFVVYLTAVVGYVFLPIRTDAEFIDEMRRFNADWLRQVNLVPLIGMPTIELSEQFLGNILLGIPFGLGLPFVLGRAGLIIVGLGAVFSIAVEAGQFLINVVYGFNYRFIDINDAILNFVGVLVGLAGFYVIRLLYQAVLPSNDGSSYVDQVLNPVAQIP